MGELLQAAILFSTKWVAYAGPFSLQTIVKVSFSYHHVGESLQAAILFSTKWVTHVWPFSLQTFLKVCILFSPRDVGDSLQAAILFSTYLLTHSTVHKAVQSSDNSKSLHLVIITWESHFRPPFCSLTHTIRVGDYQQNGFC